MKSTITMAAMAALLLPWTAQALDNGDFSDLDQRGLGDVDYSTEGGIGFLPSWTLLTPTGGLIRTGVGFGAQGDSAFGFNALDDGFGTNKLEQCLPIDPDQSLSLRYAVRTSVSSSDVRSRLNPNFYPDMAACEENLQADANSNRLSFARSNEDIDLQLTIDANTWVDTTPVVFAASDLPEEARVLRISLRARDRSGQSAEVFFDNVRATQGESQANLIRNGSFEHLDVVDGDFLNADSGWYVERDAGLRAAAGAVSFAQSGNNVFYFESLTGNFGASRLDQCVPVTGDDTLRPSVRAMSLTPDDDLNLRVNLAFFTDNACTDAADSALNLEQDFSVNGDSGQWLTFTTDDSREAAALAGIGSARLSLRARDRSSPEGNVPGPFARTLYLDDVNLVATVPAPTFNPPSQEFSSAQLVITLNGPEGSTLFYTLDGSNPDQTSLSLLPGETITITDTTEVRAIAVLDDAESAVRSATYTRVEAPFVPPTGPLNRSTGSIGFVFGLFGMVLLFRRHKH